MDALANVPGESVKLWFQHRGSYKELLRQIGSSGTADTGMADEDRGDLKWRLVARICESFGQAGALSAPRRFEPEGSISDAKNLEDLAVRLARDEFPSSRRNDFGLDIARRLVLAIAERLLAPTSVGVITSEKHEGVFAELNDQAKKDIISAFEEKYLPQLTLETVAERVATLVADARNMEKSRRQVETVKGHAEAAAETLGEDLERGEDEPPDEPPAQPPVDEPGGDRNPA